MRTRAPLPSVATNRSPLWNASPAGGTACAVQTKIGSISPARPGAPTAIVAAGADDVDLVVGRQAEFTGRPMLGGEERAAARLPGEALRVAVTVGIHQRVREGIVRRHAAVRRQPEDLAGWGRQVLRQFGLEGVAGRDIEHAAVPERDASAVVKGPARQAVEDDAVEAAVIALVAQANDAVLHALGPAIGLHGVDVGRARKVRVHGQSQEAALAIREDAQE